MSVWIRSALATELRQALPLRPDVVPDEYRKKESESIQSTELPYTSLGTSYFRTSDMSLVRISET
jgi:hypothetical protein